MKKQTFNPHDWLPKNGQQGPQGAFEHLTGQDLLAQVEKAVQAVEQRSLDLTQTYMEWVRLAFALIDGLGEQPGREMFHRISRFHPEYEVQACDQQFDRCLKSGGGGVHLATFFHHVKEAGIDLKAIGVEPASADFQNPFPGNLASAETVEEPLEEGDYEKEEDLNAAMEAYRYEFPLTDQRDLPCFPDEVYEQLPHFLKQVMRNVEDPAERDVLLLGALTSLSAVLPNVYGIYGGKRVLPNLFLFVTAAAAAGKGRLGFAKNLVKPIDKELREKSKELKREYEASLAAFQMDKKNTEEKPKKPAKKMLILPGNSSASGMIQLLGENGERGLIFETEGDTISQTFKTDHGDYSDSFRKAFHHESISLFRRTEDEHILLEEPALSAVLSGTPRQIKSLIKDAENGLFSRFVFYYLDLRPGWDDVFDESLEQGLDEYYLQLGEEFGRFHKTLEKRASLRILLSDEQKQRFFKFWSGLSYKYEQLQPREFIGSVRRMGLISFRLAMILSCLRIMEEGWKENTWTCRDVDFEIGLQMAEVLLRHSSHVFYGLPMAAPAVVRSDRQERLLERLPSKFTSKEARALGVELGISQSTLGRELRNFMKVGLIKRLKYNQYAKVEEEDSRKGQG